MKTSLLAPIAVVFVGLFSGCVTSKVASVNPTTGATNIVTVVNQDNLTLDASMLRLVTSIGVSFAMDKDQSILPQLKTVKIAVDGILHGTSSDTTQTVIDMLKASNNQTLSSEVAILLKTVSGIEQNLLAKYGQSNAGAISLAITGAISDGLGDALAGK